MNVFFSSIAAFSIAGLMWIPSISTPSTDEVGMGTLPILILNCRTDPGDVNPSGGRAIGRDELEREYGCAPAANVGVTVWNHDLGFRTRCDTDAEGSCSVRAPGGPDLDLFVAEHTAMLDPAFEPIETVSTTINYTEFAGVGIVNLPSESNDPVQRRILTVRISGCEPGVCDMDEILAQLSPAEITSRGAAWLAPDADGTVTFDLGALDSDSADLKFNTESVPYLSCIHEGTAQEANAAWTTGEEGRFFRIDAGSEDSIECYADFTRGGTR